MSLARLGPKSGSRHVRLIVAWTGQQGPVLHKGDNAFHIASCPAEGGPVETGGGGFRPQKAEKPYDSRVIGTFDRKTFQITKSLQRLR